MSPTTLVNPPFLQLTSLPRFPDSPSNLLHPGRTYASERKTANEMYYNNHGAGVVLSHETVRMMVRLICLPFFDFLWAFAHLVSDACVVWIAGRESTITAGTTRQ